MKMIRLKFVYSLSIEKFITLHCWQGFFSSRESGLRYFLTHGNIRKHIQLPASFKTTISVVRVKVGICTIKCAGCRVVPCSAVQCPPGQQSSGDRVLAMVIYSLCIRIQQSHNTSTLDWNGHLSKVTDESFRLSIHKFIFDVFDSVQERAEKKPCNSVNIIQRLFIQV